MTTVEFVVQGMSCTGCSQSIVRRLQSITGVHSASADHVAGTASITYDEQVTTPEVLRQVIESLGYEVSQ